MDLFYAMPSALQKLHKRIGLEHGAGHGPGFQGLRTGPFREIRAQAGVKKVELWRLVQPCRYITVMPLGSFASASADWTLKAGSPRDGATRVRRPAAGLYRVAGAHGYASLCVLPLASLAFLRADHCARNEASAAGAR